jgi:hypothetical protein
MLKVKKAFEHAHQVLLVALQNRSDQSYQQNKKSLSILSYLIRSDDELLMERQREKNENIREREATQRRRKHHEEEQDQNSRKKVRTESESGK